MRILLYNFGSYIHQDVLSCLQNMGHQCKSILYKLNDRYQDDYFTFYVKRCLSENRFDCVFSTNFHPLLAQICNERNIRYLSWSYDSPISTEDLNYYALPANDIFLFDREEVLYFRSLGIEHIYHLPLAVNPKRLSSLTITDTDRTRYGCDVSFVGQFYPNPLNTLLSMQNDYIRGYINALTDTQLKLYGYNLLAELIDESLLQNMNQNFTEHGVTDVRLTSQGLLKTIEKEITRRERIALLSILGQEYQVHYYSNEKLPSQTAALYCGSVHYFTEMPKVFRLSKINLNPPLRCIHSGISLRALDIMASGGFLLSGLQPELLDYFEPERDIAVYDNLEDAIYKAEYYLNHDDIRKKMIQNAGEILLSSFSYKERLNTIFQTAGL